MFDSKDADATMYPDGENFFKNMNSPGPGTRKQDGTAQSHPECPTELGMPGNMATLVPLDDVKSYNEDKYPAAECPVLADASSDEQGWP